MQCGLPSLHGKFHIASGILWAVAYAGTAFTTFTGKQIKITPFTVKMLLIHRYFSIAKARYLLGYEPVVTFEEGWVSSIEAIKKRMGL